MANAVIFNGGLEVGVVSDVCLGSLSHFINPFIKSASYRMGGTFGSDFIVGQSLGDQTRFCWVALSGLKFARLSGYPADAKLLAEGFVNPTSYPKAYFVRTGIFAPLG